MHFYTQTGEPQHWMPNASKPGQKRPTTTRDAKKENLIPSVTTIMGILDKPALTSWKVDQHLNAAFQLSPEQFKTVDEYKLAVKRLTRYEMDKAPKAGTDVHDALENYFLDQPHDHPEICYAVETLLIEKGVNIGGLTPEQRFASPLGYAGMCDASSSEWVIDYKTKQEKDKFDKIKIYPEHPRQLAAYREGLGYKKARCANVFICIETNEVKWFEHDESLLKDSWLDFLDCLNLWQRNNFNTSF